MPRTASASIRSSLPRRRRLCSGVTATSRGTRFDERYNSDLANNLGNLVSRVDGDGPPVSRGTVGAAERAVALTDAALGREVGRTAYRQSMDALAIHDAAGARRFDLIDATNLHIADNAAVGPRQGSGEGRPADAGAVRRRGGAATCCRAAVARSCPASTREILRRVGISAIR